MLLDWQVSQLILGNNESLVVRKCHQAKPLFIRGGLLA